MNDKQPDILHSHDVGNIVCGAERHLFSKAYQHLLISLSGEVAILQLLSVINGVSFYLLVKDYSSPSYFTQYELHINQHVLTKKCTDCAVTCQRTSNRQHPKL